MTPAKKLLEIEKRFSGQHAHCIGGSFSAIQQARYDFANNCVEDMHWLIERVKELESLILK